MLQLKVQRWKLLFMSSSFALFLNGAELFINRAVFYFFFESFHNARTSLIFVLIIHIFLHTGLNDNFSQKYKFIKILTLVHLSANLTKIKLKRTPVLVSFFFQPTRCSQLWFLFELFLGSNYLQILSEVINVSRFFHLNWCY